VNYVWCSECFDASSASKYTPASLIAPSSSPAEIYRELKRDVDGNDRHSAKITAQKATFTSLAVQWESAGEITPSQRDDIIYMLENAPFSHWRPLLFVIPRMVVAPRLKIVPYNKRASYGPEYIVEDLQRHEFDIIEL